MTTPTKLTPSANGAIPVVPGLMSTLSVDGLTWSNTGNDATSGQAFGDNPLSGGSYYFEVTLGVIPGGNDYYFGVCQVAGRSATQGMIFAPNGSASIGNYANSQVVKNGASAGIQLGGTATTGDVIGVAVALPNLIWFRRNGGNWNNNGGADPATGVGGLNISDFAAPIVPYVTAYEGACTLAFNFGQNPFVDPAPALFIDWPGGEALTVTGVTYDSGNVMQIAGSSVNGSPAALQYSIDNQSTWTACGGYTPGPTWTVTGPTITASYAGTLFIKDPALGIVSPPFAFTHTPPVPSSYTTILTGNYPDFVVSQGTISGAGNSINVGLWVSGAYTNCVASMTVTPAINASHYEVTVDYDIRAQAPEGTAPPNTPNPFAFELSPFRGETQTDPATIYVSFDRDATNTVRRGSLLIQGPAAGAQAVAYPTDGRMVISVDYDSTTMLTTFSVTINGTLLYASPPGGEAIGNSTIGEILIQLQAFGGNQGPEIGSFSNLFVYDTTPPAESLTITSASTPGGLVDLAGTNPGTLAAALDYALDAGAWSPVTSYVGGATWTGQGPSVLTGAHTIQVRDHDQPTILSNTETFSITLGIFVWDGVTLH